MKKEKMKIVKAGNQGSLAFLVLLFLVCATSTLLIFFGTQRELSKIGAEIRLFNVPDSKGSNQTAVSRAAVETISEDVDNSIGEVTRRMRVERGSDIIENVFFRDHQEIARQIIAKDGKITQSGRIPDGKVKFFDDFNNTYGEEHYRYNRKHGIAKTYYNEGRLKSEEKFGDGKLLSSKEYYNTGVLRLEVNQENASDAFDQTEIGIGKLYFPDGVLKYEWNFTKNNRVHFRKAYHRNGQLRAEAYYDADGNVLEDFSKR